MKQLLTQTWFKVTLIATGVVIALLVVRSLVVGVGSALKRDPEAVAARAGAKVDVARERTLRRCLRRARAGIGPFRFRTRRTAALEAACYANR